jgi:hypothetical protein
MRCWSDQIAPVGIDCSKTFGIAIAKRQACDAIR